MTLSDRIKKLIEILREEDLDEIEVRNWFSGIRIARRRGASSAAMVEDTREEPEAESAPMAEAPVPEAVEAAAPVENEGLEEIVSPMVGTFYRSAGQEVDPFISVGSRVETGQVLCIIEAMKVMNEIKAETSGTITELLCKPGQALEFDQALFKVRPN